MKSMLVTRVLALGLFLALAGCSGMKISEANDRFTALYTAKAQALAQQQRTPLDAAERPGIDAQVQRSKQDLAKLADEAAAAATEQGDALAKIAFYRVAALAAWQGDNPMVLKYSSAGEGICQQQPGIAPRDCGLLAAVPYFVATDSTTKKLNREYGEYKQREGERLSRDEKKAYADTSRAIMRDYRSNIGKLLELRPSILGNNASAELKSGFDVRMENLICKSMDTGHNFFDLTHGPRANKTMSCRVWDTRLAALNAGMAPNACLRGGAERIEKRKRRRGCR